MKNLMFCSVLACVALTIAPFAGSAEDGKKDAKVKPRMMVHDVFFTLKDDSPEAKQELVAGCKKYLSDQPGTLAMAAGSRVEELDREVNDQAFDVALHIVFKDKAAHDAYQKAEKHKKFIEEFKGNWKSVRVFDSWLDVVKGD